MKKTRNIRHKLHILISLLFSCIFLSVLYPHTSAQNINNKTVVAGPLDSIDSVSIDTTSLIDNDRLSESDTVSAKDSAAKDLNNNDTVLTTSSENNEEGDEEPIVLDDVMYFSAQDSMVVRGSNEVFFWGPSNVKYKSSNLRSNFMKMRVDSSQVYARYVLDSLGRPIAYPIFTDEGQTVESETIRYNYNTEKGFITGILTQQGEGYITGSKSKRMPDNVMFMEGGNYTTCNHVHNPHFCIHMTRAKVTPNKNIVSGPFYIVMAGVPLYPIGLPFGFFPLNEHQTTGIIFPSYGEDIQRGFYLKNFGYYWAINDYVDVTFRGDIYTLGSWSAYADVNYSKRYKYSGSMSFGLVNTKYGDKSIRGDYRRTRDFSFNWSHRQDAKVDPLRTFSASVNFSTSSYNHNSQEAMYDFDKRAQNSKSSSVSYSRRFTKVPLNITLATTIDQRSKDSTISMSLPNMSISLSTIYPFKRKKAMGKTRWYEKISISYSGNLRNSITTKEHLLLKSNLLRDWQNGMSHQIPISASFDLFDNIKITPSFSYSANWVTKKVEQGWNEQEQRIMPTDTVFGFYHLQQFNASISASTTLYGFYRPWRAIFGNKIQMIRHRIMPNISFSYAPDFGSPFWGYYKKIYYTDANGIEREFEYSPFQGGAFSAPGRGKNGSINFSVNNNLEMKIRDSRDSINGGTRKISLIDQFDWRASYNMAADSFKWSNINASIAIRFSPRFTLRLSGDFDTYLYDYTLSEDGRPIPKRINKLRILNGKGFGRLISTGTGFSYTFNNRSFDKLINWIDKKFGKNKEKERAEGDSSPTNDNPISPFGNMPNNDVPKQNSPLPIRGDYSRPDDMGVLDNDGYVSWNFPWSLSFNYSMNIGYDYQNFNIEKREYEYDLRHNLSVRGSFQPTQNWSFDFDANYNFKEKRITNFSLRANRKLHCWDLSANIIPFGPYKSYSITIGVNASILKDMKYNQSSLNNSSSGGWY